MVPQSVSEHQEQRQMGPYLLDQVVSLRPLILATINRHAILVKLEGQAQRVSLDAAVLEAACAELLRDLVENLDVMGNASSIMLGDDRDITQSLALNDILSVGVREFSSRSANEI